MNQQSELSVMKKDAGALVKPSEGLSIASAFQAVMEGNISSEKVAVMKELLAMDAEQKFNAAFVKLQSELPVIVAESIIPNRGKYAKFEAVMAQISKPLQNNGFSVSFNNECVDNRVIETCTLRHIGGHSKSNKFAVRVGKADTETQADCKAATTAKRNALLNALNIVVSQDIMLREEDDATLEGDPNAFVTSRQAEELERRVSETNSNRAAFLQFAGASKFSEIRANRYDELDRKLQIREREGR